MRNNINLSNYSSFMSNSHTNQNLHHRRKDHSPYKPDSPQDTVELSQDAINAFNQSIKLQNSDNRIVQSIPINKPQYKQNPHVQISNGAFSLSISNEAQNLFQQYSRYSQSQPLSGPVSVLNVDEENGIKDNSTTAKEILAGIAGVIGIPAATGADLTDKQVTSSIPEGNGIWVPEGDRSTVLNMINKAASKQYEIDNKGFVKVDQSISEDPSKSTTYSKVLDALIAGNKKVVVGVNDEWLSYDGTTDLLQRNSFTDGDNGITIGDNGTDQKLLI